MPTLADLIAPTEQAQPDIPTVAVDTTPPAPTVQASVFADPADVQRYNEAIAGGATEEEALKVGDNGRGAWGDDTTSTTDPIVALSPDTPGFARNRKVILNGPKGQVVARIADKGPPGRIDLNPAAAVAVGHPGGVIPVTWKYADPVSPTKGLSALTPIGSGQPEVSVDPDTGDVESEEPTPDNEAAATDSGAGNPLANLDPHPQVASQDDNKVTFKNGLVIYRDGTKEISHSGQLYQWAPGATTPHIVPDPAAGGKPSAFLRKEASQMGINVNGLSEGDIAKAMEDKQISDGIIPPHLLPVAQNISRMIINRPMLKDFIKVREAKDVVDSGYSNPDDHGFSDMAMIEGFQRIVNPGSIVRVQTIDQMQKAIGSIASKDPHFLWAQAIQGDKLTQTARDRIKHLADVNYQEKLARIEPYTSGIKGLAKSYGMKNPNAFVDNTMRMANELSGIENAPQAPDARDQQALEWVNDPKNQVDPYYKSVLATVKSKGLIGAESPGAQPNIGVLPGHASSAAVPNSAKQSAADFLKQHKDDPQFKSAIDSLKQRGLL